LFLVCAVLQACGEEPTEAPTPSRVAITSTPITLTALGATEQLDARVFDQRGAALPGRALRWATSREDVALVSQDGLVTAAGNGSARITATAATVSDSATVTVRQKVSLITVSPHRAFAVVGDTVDLIARAYDSTHHRVAGTSVTWSSGDITVADVDQAGRIRAAGIGETNVAASAGGLSGSMLFTAVAGIEKLEITPSHAALSAVGDTLRMGAIALEAGGHRLSGTRFTWASTEPRVATVDSLGLVTARGLGESTITAASHGVIGRTRVTVASVQFAVVTAGFRHSCAATPDGAAFCWGDNESGRLGDGTASDGSTVPIPVTGAHEFRKLSAGREHTCGVTTAGKAYCWGLGGSGQLGDGTTDYGSRPRLVRGDYVFSSVSAGYLHTCGVTDAGRALCWGYNVFGQLGNGKWSWSRTTPVPVSGELRFAAANAGRYHSCGLTLDGAAYCWGYNGDGQLGDTAAIPESRLPVPVLGAHFFTAISPSEAHTCGLAAGGAAYCWGWNGDGRLGTGTTEPSAIPVQVAGGHQFASISAGYYHTCGVSTDGIGYCWGNNAGGQLGDGTMVSRTSPVPVAGGHRFAFLSAGGWHTCGLTTEDTAYCWGWNEYGQIGDATLNSSTLPVRVAVP
jgi:alpha-tubulin suppressor-like RCC1 family protein